MFEIFFIQECLFKIQENCQTPTLKFRNFHDKKGIKLTAL